MAGGGGLAGMGGGRGDGEGGQSDGGDDGQGGAGEAGGPNCILGEPGCPPTVAEEVAYLLHPGHAPDKCIDLRNFSVEDGTAAIQYTCQSQTNQVFWAEPHADGYIALRGALSGKCLGIADASLAPNAPLELGSCSGAPSQLFQPVSAGDDLVRLVAKHSNLFIDVSGVASTANLELIVQNPDDGNADMTWQLQPAAIGAYVTLAPDDRRDLRLRHDGEQILLEVTAEVGVEWKIVQGLANPDCVSFASRDDDVRFLRQRNFSLFREANDSTEAFALDATFCLREPFEGGDQRSRPIESESHPGYFLVHGDTGVALTQSNDSAEFRTAATWRIGQLEP